MITESLHFVKTLDYEWVYATSCAPQYLWHAS